MRIYKIVRYTIKAKENLYIDGGKDSCYNMMQCVAAGHKIVALANLRPAHTDELDSYMYQTVGHQAIELYADAMELPLYRRTIQGSSLDTSRNYSETEGDEVEDLYQLLYLVKVGFISRRIYGFFFSSLFFLPHHLTVISNRGPCYMITGLSLFSLHTFPQARPLSALHVRRRCSHSSQ
uniref:Diphthamine biosynthesis 6 n=1 Tax=Poecilia latipinna TaxID=48699 RepID=A0A3B3V0Q2_9TELE